jgi:2'-5' RNA ligase
MSERLFFALWPDERLREALEAQVPTLLAGIRGKAQRPDQWHVTLEFLGDVPLERQAAVREAATHVVAAGFTVVFDELDYWRRPQVYCLSASDCPPMLTRLVTDLRAALRGQGLVPESRDYRPHVTLARKVRRAPVTPLAEPIAWPAERYALVRSVSDAAGSRYEPLRWWNLRGRSG